MEVFHLTKQAWRYRILRALYVKFEGICVVKKVRTQTFLSKRESVYTIYTVIMIFQLSTYSVIYNRNEWQSASYHVLRQPKNRLGNKKNEERATAWDRELMPSGVTLPRTI